MPAHTVSPQDNAHPGTGGSSSNAPQPHDLQALFQELDATPQGLSSGQAQSRLQQYGPNALTEHKESQLKKLVGYFWGPIPWMIETAALLSLLVRHWADLVIILVMLIFNAVIGFWEEHKASNALDALKNQLALGARALRDGSWKNVDAKDLVPGDVVRIRLGDVIPADAVLIEGAYLSVDQAALTGESLPVTKKTGEEIYSGSVAKQGEMVAMVKSTGSNTFFGRTAKLVETAGAVSHFQKAVMRVGDFLIVLAVGLSLVLTVTELMHGHPWMQLLQFVLILVVASIPVAMPAVLSVTMALGALTLSREKAIVSRLQSIEEMAGIDILCSDKTGTLTLNQLTLGKPTVFAAKDEQELILYAALACKEENQDPLDLAIIKGLQDQAQRATFRLDSFTPFDPISKRTEARLTEQNGRQLNVSKGAPQVILDLCQVDAATRERAEAVVDELAATGYRALGVARTAPGGAWSYLGLLSFFDPPRGDSAQTISQAKEYGIDVKMVTGDDLAIGREISGQLGLGTHLLAAAEVFEGVQDPSIIPRPLAQRIEKAEGFARVFPEHKYGIVHALQEQGHLVAMTGDGVNDAPALKQADVGVAVSGATDAARAAADLVLTAPGLSVIIKAVEEARRIFERMMSYTIYRIAMTIDIMFFVVLAMVVYHFYPLTPVMIILLALLDDIPIMTIAYDNTGVSQTPVRWDMRRVLIVSGILGALAVTQSFALLVLGRDIWQLDQNHQQTMLFLQLVAGGHLMLFLTRTKSWFWKRPHPSGTLFSAIVGTQALAVLMCGLGWLVPQLPWKIILLVWGYNIAWMFLQDTVKVLAYAYLDRYEFHLPRFVQLSRDWNRPLFAMLGKRTKK